MVDPKLVENKDSKFINKIRGQKHSQIQNKFTFQSNNSSWKPNTLAIYLE